jgi:hypothetical protein
MDALNLLDNGRENVKIKRNLELITSEGGRNGFDGGKEA